MGAGDIMKNNPRVKINFLDNTELVFLATSELNPLANLSKLNSTSLVARGKKGFHFSGGSVNDNTNETSGCLLDGTYTFYGSATESYDGFMGNELSGDDYSFATSQYLTIGAAEDGLAIQTLVIKFDGVSGEYAAQMSFSDAINLDGTINTSITPTTKISNDGLVFVHNFGDVALKQVTLNIEKWSKKNALAKISRITTGYVGDYGVDSIKKIDFSINKVNDETQLRFGVSTNSCVIEIIDNDGMVKALYDKDLIGENLEVNISVDGVLQGVFYISDKNSEKGSLVWTFDCVDKLQLLKDIKCPLMPMANRRITAVTKYVLSGFDISAFWEKAQYTFLGTKNAGYSFFDDGQTLYDLLLKCCQAGAMRIYVDRNGVCKLTRGLM